MFLKFTRTATVWFLTLTVVCLTGVGAVVAHEGHDHEKDKEKEKAEPVDVGAMAPDFTLVDTEGNEHTLSAYLEEEKIVVLEWFNPNCPFVKKHHKKFNSMAETYQNFEEKNVVWLAVNSGGPGKEGHGVEKNQKAIEEYGIAYPVLMDEKGEVGRMYGAKTTPHLYVISAEGMLLYRGPLDEKPSPSELGDENYVIQIVTQILAGEEIDPEDKKSYGCSVKYAKPL